MLAFQNAEALRAVRRLRRAGGAPGSVGHGLSHDGGSMRANPGGSINIQLALAPARRRLDPVTEQGKRARQNRGKCTQAICFVALDALGDNLVIPHPPGLYETEN